MIALPRLGQMAAAEAPIPEGFWPKVRWTLTYTTSWMVPLVAIERFADGHYDAGWILAGCFVLNLVVVSRWDQLSALFSERRSTLVTWGLIVAGAILLGIGLYRLGLAQVSPNQSTELQSAREAKGKSEQELASVAEQLRAQLRERQALDRQLAETRLLLPNNGIEK